MDKVCSKIKLLHLDEKEDNLRKMKYLTPNFSEKIIEGDCEIKKHILKTGQKRKVHVACGKISPKQKIAKSGYVETSGFQCLDIQTNSENNSSNTDNEIKTLKIQDFILNIAPESNFTFSNLTDLTAPEYSVASAARTQPFILSKRPTVSKTESLFADESFNAGVSKSATVLQSKSVFGSTDELTSLSPYLSQSSMAFASQDVLNKKSSLFSSRASLSGFTTKSPFYKRQLSPDVFSCKTQIVLKPDSLGKRESSNIDKVKPNDFSDHLTKLLFNQNSQNTSRTDLLVPQNMLKLNIAKPQKASKMKFSLIRRSSCHLPTTAFNRNSSSVSIKRFKRQRRYLLKKVKRKVSSVKSDTSKLEMPKGGKTMKSNKQIASANQITQIENSSCQKVKNVEKNVPSIRLVRDISNSSTPIVSSMPLNIKKNSLVVNNELGLNCMEESCIDSKVEKSVPSINFFARDIGSTCTPIVNSISLNIKRNSLVVNNELGLSCREEYGIDSKYGLENISGSHKTTTASMPIVKFSGRKIVYNEKSEERRKHTMSLIKTKQKLLKNIIMQGKYFQNRNLKDKLILMAEEIQSDIDLLFQNFDEVGKMPNFPKRREMSDPKMKKAEYINNFQTLLHLLRGKIRTEVTIENINEFLNFRIIEDAFHGFQDIKKKQLKIIEASKYKMNLDLQDFVRFLKLNRENISNVSLPNIHDVDIFHHCGSLRRAVESNLRHLLSLRIITSNLMKSVQNYMMSEKLLFAERNSFVFKNNSNFFTLKKIREFH